MFIICLFSLSNSFRVSPDTPVSKATTNRPSSLAAGHIKSPTLQGLPSTSLTIHLSPVPRERIIRVSPPFNHTPEWIQLFYTGV